VPDAGNSDATEFRRRGLIMMKRGGIRAAHSPDLKVDQLTAAKIEVA
jgi:hypothetical protein